MRHDRPMDGELKPVDRPVARGEFADGADAGGEGVLRWIAGDRAGTATRVRLEMDSQAEGRGEAQVRIEQMVFHAELGWYVQKSVAVPAGALAELGLTLREADCLIPKPVAVAWPLHPAMHGPHSPRSLRRNA